MLANRRSASGHPLLGRVDWLRSISPPITSAHRRYLEVEDQCTRLHQAITLFHIFPSEINYLLTKLY